ncbi:regulator [Streptomyces globosus]|uniref:Regulator n=1 Tax=Streptomyces globosus TaxID=68209 RepID=A0A344TZM4_9ACTN|nr:regulator [Streptomyces globosus]
MEPESALRSPRTPTLEAYADTIVPGEKRWPGDAAIAGAADGGGAVAAGAIQLLEWDATGLTEGLDDLADLLNRHARTYADGRGLALDTALPPFVALDFGHRTALVAELTAPGHPEKEFWVLLALFSNMAYDSAAHMHTADAIAQGHPGLAAMGVVPPGPDRLWRFDQHSYGRRLARVHPDTTPSGSPA